MSKDIDGVRIKKLLVIPDERGWLMEILRCDEDIFKKFGQVYLTTAYPGVVKAWHYHKKQTDNFTCMHGMMKVGSLRCQKGFTNLSNAYGNFCRRKEPGSYQCPAWGISRVQRDWNRYCIFSEYSDTSVQLPGTG